LEVVTIYQSTTALGATTAPTWQFPAFRSRRDRFLIYTDSGDRISKELLEQVSRRDAAALRAIYQRCSGRVLALSLRILRTQSEAEEVVQETFLEIWKRAHEYDPRRGGIEGWVLTIARSRAIDRLRSQGIAARYHSAATLDDSLTGLPVVPDSAEQKQERARVEAALGALPAEQRRVVELAYYEGLSQSEISERTGTPLGTVKTRVRLAMEKLSQLLRDSDRGPLS
jgi:RNA polymerase sigma-70 factor (ECF subfamily)